MAKPGVKLALVLLLAIQLGSAIADQYHYNNMLIGPRASGLAGAYTAVSDDASGLFYNPAGIVFSEDSELSASANAIHSSSLKYKGVLRGGDWERDSSLFIPNYFGITSRLGDGYFGFSYAVTDSKAEDQDSAFTSIPGISLFVININDNESTIKIGPSYARQITDSLNAGITLYFHNRERETLSSQWIRLSADDTFEWSSRHSESSESGIEPVLGLIWTPSETLSFGLSLRKTFISSSKTRNQETCSSDINDPTRQASQCIPVGGTPLNPTISENFDERDLPLNIRLGAAYFPTNRLLLSFDLSYYEEIDSSAFSAEETVNFAAGAEYYLTAAWALRGGFYSSNSNTPKIQVGGINQEEHVDLAGISLSISHFTRKSSVTLGFNYASGDGKAQVIDGSADIQDVEQSILSIYLSTSYRF